MFFGICYNRKNGSDTPPGNIPTADDVKLYLQFLQSNISRMSSTSSSCKSWCVLAMVPALSLGAKLSSIKAMLGFSLVCLIFCCLDTFYLMMERFYRNVFNDVVRKYRVGSYGDIDLFNLNPFIGRKGCFPFLITFFSKTEFLTYLAIFVTFCSVGYGVSNGFSAAVVNGACHG